MSSVITLSGVCFDYALRGISQRVLSDVCLEIAVGDFVAIVGASGSGKSTLMNLMGLMATPSAGAIELGGVNIAGLDADARATLRNQKIGFIFQQFHLLPKLSVLENILLPARYATGERATAAPAKARALLEQLGLTEQSDKLPAQLSGGQKQRVAIARALVLDPVFLLADEPTGALDTKNTAGVLAILRELNAQGSTIVLITHDPAVAAHAHRVVRIHDGSIVGDSRTAHAPTEAALGETTLAETAQTKHLALPKSAFGLVFQLRAQLKSGLSLLKYSAGSLAAHRVRSGLTVMGLGIGVAAIIIMLSLSIEARKSFAAFFDSAGARKAFVQQNYDDTTKKKENYWPGLRVDSELPEFSRRFPDLGRLEPGLSASNCKVTSPSTTITMNLETLNSVQQVAEDGFRLNRGRFFAPQEFVLGSPARPVLLGAEAAEKLFPKEDLGAALDPQYPLGQTIFLRGCGFGASLVVVGLLKSRDSTFDKNTNLQIYVPVPTFLAGGLWREARYFLAAPLPGVRTQKFGDSVASVLKISTRGAFNFKAYSSEQELGFIDLMLNILGALTFAIGLLCTCIGGIGVMNIMLVNITERMREIGLRKALGARGPQIRNQFLLESVILCLVAGLLGVAFGTVASNIVIFLAANQFPQYLSYAFSWNYIAFFVALGTSAGAGIVFGLVPARRAARMDVVESLRQE